MAQAISKLEITNGFITAEIRTRAFALDPRTGARHMVRVPLMGLSRVEVYDDVAKQYTKAHLLSASAEYHITRKLRTAAERLPTYEFQPYDVIQVLRGDKWLDFATLRTADEGRRAVNMVDTGKFDGDTLTFRIRRGFNEVVYSRSE